MAEGEKMVKTFTITKVKYGKNYGPKEPIELPESIYKTLVRVGAVAKAAEEETPVVATFQDDGKADQDNNSVDDQNDDQNDGQIDQQDDDQDDDQDDGQDDDPDDNQVIPREVELEEFTVPVLQEMAEKLGIDTKKKRKADLIADIVAAEEILQAAEQDGDE